MKTLALFITVFGVGIHGVRAATTVPHTFLPNTPALASEVNTNFGALASAIDKMQGNAVFVSTTEELVAAVDNLPGVPDTSSKIILAPGGYVLDAPLFLPGDGITTLTSLGGAGIFNDLSGPEPVLEVTPGSGAVYLTNVSLYGGSAVLSCDDASVHIRDVEFYAYDPRFETPIVYATLCALDANRWTIDHAFAGPPYSAPDGVNIIGGTLRASNSQLGKVALVASGGRLWNVETSTLKASQSGYLSVRNASLGGVDLSGDVTLLLAYSAIGLPTSTTDANGTPTWHCIGNYQEEAGAVSCP